MTDRRPTLYELIARRAVLECRVGQAYRIAAAANTELLLINREIDAMQRGDDMLPLKQAAALAKVHPDTARRWATSGKGVRRGGRWFLPRSACVASVPGNAE